MFFEHSRKAKRSRQDVSQHGPTLSRQQSGASLWALLPVSSHFPVVQQPVGFSGRESCEFRAPSSGDLGSSSKELSWPLFVPVGDAIGIPISSEGGAGEPPQQSCPIVEMIRRYLVGQIQVSCGSELEGRCRLSWGTVTRDPAPAHA